MKTNFDEKRLFDLFVNRDNLTIPLITMKPYCRDGCVYGTDCRKLIRVKEGYPQRRVRDHR